MWQLEMQCQTLCVCNEENRLCYRGECNAIVLILQKVDFLVGKGLQVEPDPADWVFLFLKLKKRIVNFPINFWEGRGRVCLFRL